MPTSAAMLALHKVASFSSISTFCFLNQQLLFLVNFTRHLIISSMSLCKRIEGELDDILDSIGHPLININKLLNVFRVTLR